MGKNLRTLFPKRRQLQWITQEELLCAEEDHLQRCKKAAPKSFSGRLARGKTSLDAQSSCRQHPVHQCEQIEGYITPRATQTSITERRQTHEELQSADDTTVLNSQQTKDYWMGR